MVGIYKITSPSGRIYIGQTRKSERRQYEYKVLHSKGQRLIYNSIVKYGWENHTFEIIHELPKDIDQSILNTYEILYIAQYQSNRCKYPENNGMNLTDGGDGNFGHKHTEEFKKRQSELKMGKGGWKHTEEAKRKIAEANSRNKRVPDEEWRRIQSEKLKGNTNKKGKRMTKEQIEANRIRNTGKIMSLETREKCRISALNRKTFSTPPSQKGRKRSLETKIKLAKIMSGGEDRIIEILDKKTKIVVDTAHVSREAAEITGCSRQAISQNLIGRSATCGDYIFKYKILE